MYQTRVRHCWVIVKVRPKHRPNEKKYRWLCKFRARWNSQTQRNILSAIWHLQTWGLLFATLRFVSICCIIFSALKVDFTADKFIQDKNKKTDNRFWAMFFYKSHLNPTSYLVEPGFWMGFWKTLLLKNPVLLNKFRSEIHQKHVIEIKMNGQVKRHFSAAFFYPWEIYCRYLPFIFRSIIERFWAHCNHAKTVWEMNVM